MKNKAKMFFTVAALSGLIAVSLLLWLLSARENTFPPRNAERFLNENEVLAAVHQNRALREWLGKRPEKVEILAQTAVQTDQSGQGWVLVKCYTATLEGDHGTELDHRVAILRFNVKKGEGADWSWQIDGRDDPQVLDCFVLFRARLANSDDSWEQNEGSVSSGSLDIERQDDDRMARLKHKVLDEISESRHNVKEDDPDNEPCPYLEDHQKWLNGIQTHQVDLVIENKEGIPYAEPAQFEKLIRNGANVLVACETKRQTSSEHASKVIVKLLN